MPIEIVRLDENTLQITYAGFITYEQLIESYQSLFDMDDSVSYVILDSGNMMYETATLFDDYVMSLVAQLLARPSIIMVISVLPENSPLREVTQQIYDRLGFGHKLCFATSINKAQQISETLKNS